MSISIEKKFEKLGPEEKQEVLDFIDFLIQKKLSKSKKSCPGFSFNWSGCLSELRNEFTSIELQHKAMEMR